MQAISNISMVAPALEKYARGPAASYGNAVASPPVIAAL